MGTRPREDVDADGNILWGIGAKMLRKVRREASVLSTEQANVEAVAETPLPPTPQPEGGEAYRTPSSTGTEISGRDAVGK
jgi:hypothetical protein